MKFLVTGASGFVGRHLVTALAQRHGPKAVTAMVHERPSPSEEPALHEMRMLGISVLAVDLLRLSEAKFHPPEFDVVYHLAGYAVTEDPNGPFAVNDEGTRNLISWMGPALRGKRFVYTGTLASVDTPGAKAPIREETACCPITPYGRTKLEGEAIVRSQAVHWNYTFTILRLCTIVGPGFRAGGMFGVFPGMLRRNALATRLNWPGRVSFLSVSDLVRTLLAVSTLPQAENALFVTSNGEETTFDTLLGEMARVLHVKRERLVLPRFVWTSLGSIAWRMARLRALPYRVRIFFWRVSHLIRDGLYADASRLNSLLGGRFQSTQDALREIYGEQN
jgi:nucleoside-diphosphate-sugar epimerase